MKIIIALLLIFNFVNVNAQEKDDKILFIEFKYSAGTPELIRMKAVKGKLKTNKQTEAAKRGLCFKVLSNKDEAIYENFIDDPTKTIYEYPGENGEIKSEEVKQEQTNFILRIPYSESIKKLIIHSNRREDKLFKNNSETSKREFEFTINHGLIEKD